MHPLRTLPRTNWHYPTPIWFGNGRIQDLQTACDTLGFNRPLFVTDMGLADFDFVQSAFNSVKNAVFYSDVQSNPTGQNVADGAIVYEQSHCDGVIALGGGSAIDCAKSIALIVRQGLSVWEFEDMGDNWTKADTTLIPKIIAIATTAGTGSEVGRAAVITDTENKKIIFHPHMMPSLVIADPELTVGLPPHITAWTGMDALTHAIEALCATNFHPMAVGIALETCRLCFENLPKAVADGTDLTARGNMLVAATMGATAFQRGLGSVHSLAHPLGAMYHTHHGLLNAIILPYALRQNRQAIAEPIAYVSRALGIPTVTVDGFITHIQNFTQQFNIPQTLSHVNIDTTHAKDIGQKAYKDPSTASNAKPITAQDLQILFEASVSGNTERL